MWYFWSKIYFMRLLAFSILVLSIISCRSDKRYHDSDERRKVTVSKEAHSFTENIEQLRAEKDEMFRDAERSPLPEEARSWFKGLNYFPADSLYRVQARLERAVVAEVVTMETTVGAPVVQEVFGMLHFSLNDKPFTLKVYIDPAVKAAAGAGGYLFLPFSDLTNGEDTYGGGRYLDLHVPEGDSLEIDFNKAYHPYCAYNSNYSCPLVPRENHLEISVAAGERL